MQLNIQDFDEEDFDEEDLVEEIPENNIPIKVIKKGVQFLEPTSVSKKIQRQQPKMSNGQNKSKISYEDILLKMGMVVSNGKLQLVDKNTNTQVINKNTNTKVIDTKAMDSNTTPNNSYIYNKYFKNEIQSQNKIRKPKTIQEYAEMIIEDHIQRQRIKQIKSTKLIMPTSNINYSTPPDVNKLFDFSKKR
jgi:hypothetical protein